VVAAGEEAWHSSSALARAIAIGARVTLLDENGHYYLIDRAGVRGWVSKRGIR